MAKLFPRLDSRRRRIALAGLLTAGLVRLLSGPAPLTGEPAILARVGNEVVTASELVKYVRLGVDQPNALEKLVEEKLLASEAGRLGYRVDPKKVETEFNRLGRQRFQKQSDFYAWLREQKIPVAEVKKRLERELLMGLFIQNEITARIEVSPMEIGAYLSEQRERLLRESSEYRLSEINFPRLESIPKDLAGLDTGFEDLGWVPFRNLSAPVQAALGGLKAGGFSTPVEISGAWVIFKVLEMRGPGPESETGLAIAARRIIAQRKSREAYQEIIKRLRDRYGVTYYN
ncbi:MAG TPA: peptidylprolyl isomerase [bacterium]|uniref:Peptidylprolyl isomerase n=1 Tax=candidate division TA06 bacterium ADurb.Bin417 TaxID=1852828 RepID=A0A1V5MFV9_UNCT6|nr:MAG: peptidylprolyl isomerase [candidate division TA06 bacterium ADurb.Bin417]HNQ35219.1 peptidylprolyl isomerase [bacterium]HNS48946.1 peptidylprolyl isomerase [bacterium]